MAKRFNIEILSQPLPSSVFLLTIENNDFSYVKTISKTFVPGVPTNLNQVQIGEEDDLQTTLLNLVQNMLANDVDGNWFIIGDVNAISDNFTIDFVPPGEYELTASSTAMGAFAIETRTYSIPDPEPVEEPFELADLSIQIIDTYENDRELRVEVTRESAPKLIFDSGDSILEPLMPSELKFDMRVPGAEDAFFKHLFTGDEKRFLVKLNAIDAEENIKLLWQGFLLPDLYSETYKNGNLFVEFSATDMIATLKNKYFKPWEYHRKINIMRLLSEIMQQTGVAQKFVVMPALVHQSSLVPWYYLNLELSTYYDGKKGENLYELLSSVLQSNLLTIRSFEGYWWLEGVNRKFEPSGNALLFDESGVYENVFEFSRNVKQLDFGVGTLNFTAKTPFKEVIVDFAGNNNNNFFPDDIVNREAYFGVVTDGEFDETSQKTSILGYWQKVGNVNITFKNADHKLIFGTNVTPSSDIVITEAMALSNYFSCKYSPFVVQNKQYRLKIELLLTIEFDIPAWIKEVRLPEAFFNRAVVYQLNLNGFEVYSNRPGFGDRKENQFFYQYESKLPPNVHKVKMNLDAGLQFDQTGFLNFRFLSPINAPYGFYNDDLLVNLLYEIQKIELIPEDNSDLKVVAERPVAFTAAYNHELKLTSSTEIGETANFGLGLQLQPYQQTISVGTQVYVENTHTFNTNAINKIFSWRFQISNAVRDILFKKLLKNSVFITRANGDEDFFNSIYTNKLGFIPQNYLYYLTDKIGIPKIPKDYKYLPKIESGDVVTLLLSNYPVEDLALRLTWKIYGENEVRSFSQIVAKILHQMHPDTFYAIEGTLLGMLFPGEIFRFFYDNDERDFVASRIEIDLFNAKTTVSGREIKYDVLTDISYE